MTPAPSTAPLSAPIASWRGGLSAREVQVASLLACAYDRVEIAAALGISAKTVDTHRHHILEKTGLRSTAALVRYALREGLVSGSQADDAPGSMAGGAS